MNHRMMAEAAGAAGHAAQVQDARAAYADKAAACTTSAPSAPFSVELEDRLLNLRARLIDSNGQATNLRYRLFGPRSDHADGAAAGPGEITSDAIATRTLRLVESLEQIARDLHGELIHMDARL